MRTPILPIPRPWASRVSRIAWWLLAGIALTLAVGEGIAGTNQDGRLVLHVSPDLSMCREGEDRDLRSCESAVSSHPGDETDVLIFVLAAFPDWASPRWLAVEFGIDYNTEVSVYGLGADVGFQLATDDWPGPGSGTSITTGNLPPIDDRISTVCWFVVYSYQDTTFEIVDHPIQGAPKFADDSTPTVLDEVRRDDLGKIGFGVPGYNPCLADVPTGACCYEDGVCVITAETPCDDEDGTYLGDDTGCDPYACIGACCFEGDCTQELPQDCDRIGGWFRGVARSCSNTACLSENVTWGELKRSYRRDY